VVALTTLITFAGAAGMYAFESPAARRDAGYPPAVQASGMDSYGEAVWWAAMMMTTIGSEQWPKTSEGRVLAFLLAVYVFAVFGYITATIASYFIGRRSDAALPPDVAAELAAVRAELAALRSELAAQPGPERNGRAGDRLAV
jgi:voltage-gated potassium channel